MCFFLKGGTCKKKKLKDQLIKDLEHEFGNIFEEKKILEKSTKHLKTMRDSYRMILVQNPKYEHPPFIAMRDWNDFILDAKEKGEVKRGITLVAERRRYEIALTTNTM